MGPLTDLPSVIALCHGFEVMRIMPSIARLLPVLSGVANYGNPLEIFLRRAFTRSGEMRIVDRRTKVAVNAARGSYHMFGETWYNHDYDVLGCPVRQNDVVVDVGANQGFFTCYAAQKGARVYAFEPNPETFKVLEGNVSRNGFNDRVIAKCAAISDFDGQTELVCSAFMGGGVDTINPGHASAVSRLGYPAKRLSVEVARLDSVIPADMKVRLLKADCEGAELAILKDLVNPERFDSIAVEFHPDAYTVESLVKTILGFGTHQLCLQHGNILHAIRTDVLLEYSRNRS
jgi:FkbM family methyltransferase